MTNEGLFRDGSVAVASLFDWMGWCSGNNEEQQIVLPLIQRGSVWKPKQIIDLWDSLLRGMPVGSFLLNHIQSDGERQVRLPGQKHATRLEGAAYGLLDGQQRTLAMLVGWPTSGGMDRMLWVDFADEPGNEHLFRLRVTTENHPFGFKRETPSAKLSVDERRRATITYRHINGIEEDSNAFPDFRRAIPYHTGKSLPVDVVELIRWFREESDPSQWKERVMNKLSEIRHYRTTKSPDSGKLVAEPADATLVNEHVEDRVEAFYKALNRMSRLQVPLILVDLNEVEAFDGNDADDPALAILFKRVGSNGTPLSNGDYIFSMIKHYCPQTHDLVEELYYPESELVSEYNIAAILSRTDVVATAVRLAAAYCVNENGDNLPDSETIDKNQFRRVLKTIVTTNGNKGAFLETAFQPLLSPDNPLGMKKMFAALVSILRYRGVGDIGLPTHALWLLKRPLIQILLFWLRKTDLNHDRLESVREEMLRFVIFWNLCVTNATKVSQAAFRILRKLEDEADLKAVFKNIYLDSVKNNSALSLYSPVDLEKLISSVIRVPSTNDDNVLLLGWSRFEPQRDESDEVYSARELYRRWWNKGNGYTHTILLWLQRDYVSSLAGSPVAGREEDTPYDYDHVLPSSHWSGWTGATEGNRILDYMPKKDRSYSVLGNSIGNVRVWSSSDNRSDGSDSPVRKLKRGCTELVNLANSMIEERHSKLWYECSLDDSNKKYWNEQRARVFQMAVEERAFSLYQRFYNDLQFFIWVETE